MHFSQRDNVRENMLEAIKRYRFNETDPEYDEDINRAIERVQYYVSKYILFIKNDLSFSVLSQLVLTFIFVYFLISPCFPYSFFSTSTPFIIQSINLPSFR